MLTKRKRKKKKVGLSWAKLKLNNVADEDEVEVRN